MEVEKKKWRTKRERKKITRRRSSGAINNQLVFFSLQAFSREAPRGRDAFPRAARSGTVGEVAPPTAAREEERRLRGARDRRRP